MAIVMVNSTHSRDLRHFVDRTSKRRLSWSLAISLAIHATAILILADMLQSVSVLPTNRPGMALPIEVALVAERPIAFSAPPETPQQATSLPPAEIIPEDKSKESRPTTAAIEMPMPLPVPQQPRAVSTPVPAAAPAFEASTDPAASDVPPPGDVSVGPVNDPDRLGGVQALRLASRFPQRAYKRPQLLSTLTVPYPLRAAFARRDGRIAALVLIDAFGKVIDTTLYPDDPFFSPTILASLRGARFAPAETVEGKPLPYWAILEFGFRIHR
jgi:outer membrane biosynthesis protein TonB